MFALLVADDADHEVATRALVGLIEEDDLLTHNYVVLETTALLQRRHGMGAVRDLHERFLPGLSMAWIDKAIHGAAVSALLAGAKAPLVDLVSFELMRRHRIDTAFAFDRHFADQGFRTVP